MGSSGLHLFAEAATVPAGDGRGARAQGTDGIEHGGDGATACDESVDGGQVIAAISEEGEAAGNEHDETGQHAEAVDTCTDVLRLGEGRPGFLEVDLVVHCGESAEGFYLSTLNTVDVQTGWVECHGVWGKGQEKVRGAIHEVRKKLPFALLGLDSDNGSEFINHELHVYCEREGITFTRSRPYKKNDSAHVEQKNWTVVRQQVGYDRYSSREALDQLNHVYGLLRLYVNFFQPVMKLMEKTRTGARVRKVYDTARTPYRRLLESAELSPQKRHELADLYLSLDPTMLRTQLDRALDQLWTMADRPHTKEASVTAFMRQASAVG